MKTVASGHVEREDRRAAPAPRTTPETAPPQAATAPVVDSLLPQTTRSCSRRAGLRGWLARTVVPSAPGAGWTAPAPNAGSRRRGGRRPRPDLERRSGLHPAAVKGDGRGMGGEPLPLRRRTRPA